MLRKTTGLLASLLVLLWVAQAGAQVAVYHSPSDNGVNPMQPLVLPVGPWESLFLYLDAGTVPSANGIPCYNGDGNDLCGFELTLDASGGAAFVDFIPSAGIVHKLTPTRLKANGLFSLDPRLGPIRVGQLKVASSQSGGEVMVMQGAVIGAALQDKTIPQSVVAATAVPEPEVWSMLVAGSLLIGALARRRARASRC